MLRTGLIFLAFLCTSFLVHGQVYPPGTTFPYEAPIINCYLPGYTGTLGPIISPFPPPDFCGSNENQQFLAFVPDGETIQMVIEPNFCVGTPMGSGIQAQIYQGLGCPLSPDGLVAVSNCESPNVAAPIVLTASDLNCGEVYYLMIDGWAGDICEYTIIDYQVLEPFPPSDPPSLNGPTTVQAGSSASYSVDFEGACFLNNPCGLFLDATCIGFCLIEPADITWTVSAPGATITGNGFDAIVNWGNSSGFVCVTIENSCYFWEECLFVEVIPPYQTFLEEEICLGQGISFCGDFITSPGSYICELTAQNGVDSTVELLVTQIVNPPIVEVFDLCNEFCFQDPYGGALFCDSLPVQVYSSNYIDFNGCFQDYTLIINKHFLSVDLPNSDSLLASQDSLLISASANSFPAFSPSYSWYGPGLDPLNPPLDSAIYVYQEGLYTVEVSDGNCTVADSTLVSYFNDECAFNMPIAMSGSCIEAPIFCGNNLEGYCSTNQGAAPDTMGNLGAVLTCPIEDNVWMQITACDSVIQFELEAFDCLQSEGLEISLLSTDDCQDFTTQAPSCQTVISGNTEDITFANLVPGATYYLMIDGINGDECGFSFSNVQGVAGGGDTFLTYVETNSGGMDGPSSFCWQDTVTFTFIGPEGTLELDSSSTGCSQVFQQLCPGDLDLPDWDYNATFDTIWTLPNDAQFVGANTGGSVQIFFTDTITGPIEVTLVLVQDSLYVADTCWTTCGTTEVSSDIPTTWTITPILEYSIDTLPLIALCQGDCTDFCGETICETGNYSCEVDCGWVIQPVQVEPLTVEDEGVVSLCENECLAWYSGDLCASGSYTFVDSLACTEYLVTVELILTDTLDQGIVELCEGSCYEILDTLLCDAGDYTLIDSTGTCPSVLIVSLAFIPEDTIDLGTIELCAGACYEWLGETYCDSGDYLIPDSSGVCPGWTQFALVVLSPDTLDLDTIELCEDECFNWDGTDYCTPGDYLLEEVDSCISYTQFVIEIIPTDTTNLGFIEVCAGQCFEFQGQNYCQSGAYSVEDLDPCPSYTIWDLVILPPDTIDLGIQQLCVGECYSLGQIDYCQAGEYEIINTDSCTQVYLFELDFVPVDTIDLGLIELCLGDCFTLDGIDYCNVGSYEVLVTGPDGCLDVQTFSLIILPTTSLLIGPVVEICDATYTHFTVSFQINSDYPPYYVNGELVIGSTYNSAPIPSGSPYSFAVSDDNVCSDAAIVAGFYYCPSLCQTNAGSMSPVEINTCATAPVEGDFLGGEVLEADDALEFILHTLPGDSLGTVIDRNMDGVFVFDPSIMSFAATYYISAVAGEMENGQVNLEDVCLSVAEGQPVAFYPDPSLALETPNVLTCDQQAVQLVATVGGGIGPMQVHWFDDQGDLLGDGLTKWVAEAGTYTAELTDLTTGCSLTDEVVVQADQTDPTFSLSQAPIVCGSTTSELSIDPFDPNWQVTWTYPNGAQVQNVPSIIATESGVYSVLAESGNGCTHYISLNIVPFYAPVQAEIQTRPPTCSYKKNGAILIDSIYGGIAPYEVWLDGKPADQITLENLQAGSYFLEILDAEVCVLDTLITITPAEEIWIEGDSYYEAINGEIVDIQFTGNFEPILVEWKVGDEVRYETSSLNLPLSATESAIYRVRALHSNGCFAKAEFTVEVAFGRDIYIPNVFSPNADGVNDYFTIYGDIEIAEIRSLEILSRWGDLMFSARNIPAGVPSVGWNGRARSQRVPEGTYVYVAEVVLRDGTTQMLAGDVLLLY